MSTCPTSIVHSARGKAYRALRDLTAVQSVITGYQHAAIKAAQYYAVATGIVDDDGAALPDDVLDAALVAVTNAAALMLVSGEDDDAPVDYTTTASQYFAEGCDLTGSLLNTRVSLLLNADVMVKLPLARMAKRYTPAQSHTVFVEALKQDDLWAVIRFALLCFHVLERLGMHKVVVDELVTLFTSAQAQDSEFTLYASFLTLAGTLQLTDAAYGFVPQNAELLTDRPKLLLQAVSEAYGVNGLRAYRYDITAPHPPQSTPPDPLEGEDTCV